MLFYKPARVVTYSFLKPGRFVGLKDDLASHVILGNNQI
jgi:hypothetical protein